MLTSETLCLNQIIPVKFVTNKLSHFSNRTMKKIIFTDSARFIEASKSEADLSCPPPKPLVPASLKPSNGTLIANPVRKQVISGDYCSLA